MDFAYNVHVPYLNVQISPTFYMCHILRHGFRLHCTSALAKGKNFTSISPFLPWPALRQWGSPDVSFGVGGGGERSLNSHTISWFVLSFRHLSQSLYFITIIMFDHNHYVWSQWLCLVTMIMFGHNDYVWFNRHWSQCVSTCLI